MRIRGILGEQALRIEHVGSTAVPGVPAKPIIDIVLVVVDSADKAQYAAALQEAGYSFQIREPGWYEHRMFKGPGKQVESARILCRLPRNRPNVDVSELAADE